MAAGVDQCMAEAVEQQGTVGQPRENVMARKVRKAHFHLLARGDVHHDAA